MTGILDSKAISGNLNLFLKEDIGKKDITSAFCPNIKVKAQIVSKQNGVVAGISELKILFKKQKIIAKAHVADSEHIKKGQRIFTLSGRSRKLLSCERLALNLLGRMSGIAGLTHDFVKSAKGVKVLATRKTSPGLRYFEKKAVVAGGGFPHRMGLYDQVMLKENHLVLFGNNISKAVKTAKKETKGVKIEVEVETNSQAIEAAYAGADIVLLDNMSPKQISHTIKSLKEKGLRKSIILEASGNINLGNIAEYGATGVDWISVGALTHSVKTHDFALYID